MEIKDEKQYDDTLASLTDEDVQAYKAKYPKTFEELKDSKISDKMIVMGIKSHEDETKDELIAEVLYFVTKLAELQALLTLGALGSIVKAVVGGDDQNPIGEKKAKYEA